MSSMSSPLSPPAIAHSLSARSDGWNAQSRNPISSRLYKVLGTTYNDEGTKEALRTLSDFYYSNKAPISSVNSKKISTNEWEDELGEEDDDDALDVLKQVPSEHVATTAPGEIAARARKNMRRDVERKLAEGSRKFLDAFGDVDQKLDLMQAQISEMRIRCNEADAQLQQTSEDCDSLLERAGNLRQQRLDIGKKQSIVSLFLSRFTLTDDEIEAITSREVPVGARFFGAMDKTQRIREDCSVLMAGEEGPTKAGLDIMASTSTHLEQGYDKIARWCTFEFRQIGRDAQLEVAPTLQESVRRLRQRPELLSEVLVILSQTRASAVASAFIDALTRGGPSGYPRPIELHAHDPLRYVGDMLAWVHQVVAAEREFVESLFGANARRMVGAVRNFGETEEEDWMRELMDGSVAKLCGPLKIRVQQTVRSQESGIISYKIANLLQFYALTMRRTLGSNALLYTTLKEITDIAYQVFFDAIEAQGRALLRAALDTNGTDVTPPNIILDHAQLLREVMTVHSSSLGGDDTDAEQNKGFTRVLDAIIDPAVEMTVTAAEDKQRARPTWDASVFVLNCLTYLQDVLGVQPFAAEKRQVLEALIQERVNRLIEEHYVNVLHDTGLATAAAIVDGHRDEPLSYISATEPQALQASLHQFSEWLSGIEVVHSPRLALLSAQGLHARVHQAALARLVKTYKKLCEEVRKPENRYEAAATLLGSERPFGQVNLLRQIFGLQDNDL